MVNGYGTIAGISQAYPKGQIKWEVDNDHIKIENNYTGPHNFSLQSGIYAYDASSSIKGGEITLENMTYTYSTSNDSLFLDDNKFDGISLVLVR